MKSKLLLSVVTAIFSLLFVGCEHKNSAAQGCPAFPSYMHVWGTTTNEENQPIDSIQIIMEVQRKNADKTWLEPIHYARTKNGGRYNMCYTFDTNEKAYSEVYITAKDMLGIYEQQTKTCSVEVIPRFPNDSSLSQYFDVHIAADFVMKKK